MARAKEDRHMSTHAENPPAIAARLADRTVAPNSLNSSMIVHRVGTANPDFVDEALVFGQQIADRMNSVLGTAANTTVYRDLGSASKIHWLVHLYSPADYGKLISMADHDEELRHVYEGNRLPERGGGNWERIFVQSSFRELVIVPQHGLLDSQDHPGLGEDLFAVPAIFQMPEVASTWSSTNAPMILHRRIQGLYASRDLARLYLQQWQGAVNRTLPGEITVAQYEEVWGHQDRLHLLIHASGRNALQRLKDLEDSPSGEFAGVISRLRVKRAGQMFDWRGLFEDGTQTDTILERYWPST
ncbi:DUF6039 family protein [Mycobacterium stomatepiae]|nr:DUF6039 family protein [Mycobacterium stomatepiae]MCV7163071.1 hypothetical protein [Mycobacterium stomatepiae]